MRSGRIFKLTKKKISRMFNLMLSLYILLLPIGTGLSGIIGNISIMNYIALILIGSGVYLLFKEKSTLIHYDIIPTLLYFSYTIISGLWNQHFSFFNWYIMTNMVNFSLFLMLNLRKWNHGEFPDLHRIFIFSQIIVIIAVLKNINRVSHWRLQITIVSEIGISDFALGLCLLLAFWMYRAGEVRRIYNIIFAIGMVGINILIIVLSASRGALIMVGVMLFIWFFQGNVSIRRKRFCLFFGVLSFLFFNFYVKGKLPHTVLDRLTVSAVEQTHGSGRFTLWKLAGETYLNSDIGHMLFGYGFGSFADVVSYGNHGGHMDLLAHNFLVQTLIEGGLVGIIFLLNMIASQIKIVWKNQDALMKFAIVGLFVSALSADVQVRRIWGLILTLNCIRSSRLNISRRNSMRYET